MFDYLPDAIQAPARTDPRLLALRFLATSGGCLVRTAARVGGEAGGALAQAIRDMAVDATVDPVHWPIAEMLGMLRQHGAQPDAQVDQMIASPSDLRSRIDAA